MAPCMLLLGCTWNTGTKKPIMPKEGVHVGDLFVTPIPSLKAITINGTRYSAFNISGSFEMSMTYIPTSRTYHADAQAVANRLTARMDAVFQANGAKILHASKREKHYGNCNAAVMTATIRLKTKYERTAQILFIYKHKRYVLEYSYFYSKAAKIPTKLTKAFAVLNTQIESQLK